MTCVRAMTDVYSSSTVRLFELGQSRKVEPKQHGLVGAVGAEFEMFFRPGGSKVRASTALKPQEVYRVTVTGSAAAPPARPGLFSSHAPGNLVKP